MPGTNGATDEVEAALEEMAAPIRELHEKQEAEIASLEERLRAGRAKLAKVKAARRAIDPSFVTEPKAKRVAHPKQIRPRDRNLDQVEDAINRGATTADEVVGMTGMARDTVRRSLTWLREEERVRKAGRKGLATQWAPMPGKVSVNA